jgi:hypothetical protein
VAAALIARVLALGAICATGYGQVSGVRAEIERLERLAVTAPDKCAVTYQIARTWAVVGQNPEAMEWLNRVVDLNAGFDIARDNAFNELRDVPGFETLVQRARDATPPVLHSRFAFQVNDADLVPENLAYDPVQKRFYFGSMTKHQILRCSSTGVCSPFTMQNQDGPGQIPGLKVDKVSRTLWVVSNATSESGHFATTLYLKSSSANIR